MKFLYTFLFALQICPFFAQVKYDANWFLATRPQEDPDYGMSRIYFGEDSLFTEKVIDAPIDIDFVNVSWSDANGEFQYLSNGCVILNKNFEVMENGDSINPGEVHDSYCQSGYIVQQGAIIVPFPDDTTRQYMFHIWLADLADGWLAGQKLLYSVIDLNYNSGLGLVAEKNQSIILDTIANGQLTAVMHGNGKDWWLIMPENRSNGYYKILIDKNGPQIFDKQNIGAIQDRRDWAGQAIFSPNGNIYFRADGLSGIEVMDFDRCNGTFSNARHLEVPFDPVVPGGYFLLGAAISPNSRFAYVSSAYELIQYDLWADDIASSIDTVGVFDGFESPFPAYFFKMQSAPDGKIYMTTGNGTNVLHIIHKPNKKGVECKFEQHDITLPTYYAFDPPNFPNYRLGKWEGSPCDPTPPEPVDTVDCQLAGHVYPNPVHLPAFTLNYCLEAMEVATVSLFDATGRLVQVTELEGEGGLHEIPVDDLSNGLYFFQVKEKGKESIIGKIVVLR